MTAANNMVTKNGITEALYRNYRERLFGLVASRIRDRELAEDIVHDAFEKYERCSQTGCHCEHPRSYLFKMALNATSDHFKKEQRRQAAEQSIEYGGEPESRLEDFPCDVYECIDRFLSEVSPANREAYLKADVYNIPQQELARQLQIPVSTLKSRVQRTRAFLRHQIEHCLASQ